MLSTVLALWIPLAPVITPRQEVAVAAAGGKLYLIGGIAATTILSSVEEFDPMSGRWRLVAPLPEALHHTAAATIGDSIYVTGGYRTFFFDPTNRAYRYDTTLDQWTRIADLPSARGAHASVAIDGKIYVVGGAQTPHELLVFDPQSGTWSALASMPTGREHLAAVAFEGKLYVGGGRLRGNSAAFERYDPATNTWTSLPPLPTARSGIAAAVLDGRIHVFGGEDNPATPTGVFEQNESYDPVTNSWRTDEPMRLPRHGIGAATIDGRVHIPAGAPVQGFGVSDVHDAFTNEAPPRRRRAVTRS
jgi:N-acetylneuraminic acid mutarotase